MFPVVHQKTAMHNAFFSFWILSIFLSIEQEDIHTQTAIYVGVVSFLIFKGQKYTKIFDLTNKQYWYLQHVQLKKNIS